MRTRIKESVEMRLQKQFGKESPDYRAYRQQLGEPLVFGLSSYNALQGKLKKNRLLLAASGLPEFEAALERFLLQLFAPVELARLADSIRQSSQQLLNHIDKQATLVARQQELFEMAYHNVLVGAYAFAPLTTSKSAFAPLRARALSHSLRARALSHSLQAPLTA